MFNPEKIWYGFPGTKEFNAGSFLWGFLLCLFTTIVLLQQALSFAGGEQALAIPGAPAGEQCDDWLPEVRGPDDPWDGMKLIPRVARCHVAGLPIEELDPETNFRRFFALGFTEDAEDKTYLLPYLRAARDPALLTRGRRVLIDLGAGSWESSTLWFLHFYPLDFTEIHAFEKKPVFQPPAPPPDSGLTPLSGGSRRRPAGEGVAPIPARQLSRVKAYQKLVSFLDDPKAGVVDINRFIKTELGLTANDTVIIKMDIEGGEWDILPAWVKDPAMARIVDELFVEIHYHHPTMSAFHWDQFTRTRDEAAQLLADLRAAGFYAHTWP